MTTSLAPGATTLDAVSRPTVSVVIATLGNAAYVVEAVESILAGTLVPDELLLVDQTQPLDPRVEALRDRHPCVRVIHTEVPGLARAQNLAIRAARSELLVFTDDDVLVDERWLEEMVAALGAAGPRAGVTGRVLATEPEGAGGRAVALATDPEPAVYEGLVPREALSGNSMGFHRAAFDECGLFDERLRVAAPDNDFGYRLLRAGYRIHYVPSAVLYHRARRAGRDLRKVQWDYGRGQGAFLAKHALAGDRFMRRRMLSTVAWWLRRVARRPLGRRRPHGHGDFVYLTGFVVGAFDWWVRHGRSRSRDGR